VTGAIFGALSCLQLPLSPLAWLREVRCYFRLSSAWQAQYLMMLQLATVDLTLPTTFHTSESYIEYVTFRSTFCTTHLTLRTPPRFTLRPFLHFTLRTLHFTFHTPHSSLHPPCSPLHTLHVTLHALPFTLPNHHSTLYTSHLTLCTPKSVPHTPHFTHARTHTHVTTENASHLLKTLQDYCACHTKPLSTR
jgi:hypothetical protein